MKHLKRVLSVVLVLAMALSFAACGKNNNADGEEITLKWIVPLAQQPDEELIETELSKITKEKIGASVDFIYIDTAAYNERMTMNMASGSDFDLCFTGYINPYTKGVYNGGFLDITDLLKEEAPKLYKELPEYAWDVARYDGKIYGVPNLQGFAPPTAYWGFKDLFEKYNFDLKSVEKPDDIEPFLATIKANEPNLIPFKLDFGANLWTMGIYESITSGIGIRVDGSSPEVVFIEDTPEYKYGVSKLHDWFKKGYIRSDIMSVGSESTDWKAGRYAVWQGGWLPGSEVTTTQNFQREVVCKAVAPGVMSKEKSQSAMTAIGRNSKHPKEAIKLLELVNTDPEVMSLIALGIEGKHYKVDPADGKYEIITGSGYETSGEWIFGNQFIGKLKKGQADDTWEATEKMNLDAVKSPLLGFSLNTDEIKTLISQVQAAGAEYSTTHKIVNNNADHEKRMAKKREAGLDELMEAVQKQVDEYWKTTYKK